MVPDSLQRFICDMPKAELHLHIEGTLEPAMMLALARRNGVDIGYETEDQIRAAYQFSNLQDFLDIYYKGMSVLLHRQDFDDLASAYLAKAASQNVRHVEMFFDPQGHTSRGVSFDTVLYGLTDAMDRARRDHGITSRLIMCFLRDLGEESAFETLRHACRCKDHILGVGLDSTEVGHPPSNFARVFSEAQREGFIPVAHAGEEGPAAYVAEAIDLLGVRRIDHGNRAMEDPALVSRIAASGLPLTVCPLSNNALRSVPDLTRHPLRDMLRAGLCATVNSDDPAHFGGYVNENFLAVAEALDLTRQEITALGRNSFAGSFLADKEKMRALEMFDRFAG